MKRILKLFGFRFGVMRLNGYLPKAVKLPNGAIYFYAGAAHGWVKATDGHELFTETV